MTNEVTFLYVKGTEIGYARMGSYIAQEFDRRGITIYDDDGNPNTDVRTIKLLTKGERVRAEGHTNLMLWASVPGHITGFFEGQHVAIFTMWEATSLPEQFRENFHQIDTIIVPSQQNVELFGKFHPNVKYAPLGIDPTLWHYSPPPPRDREFRFLINGKGTRKGTDLAYKAFKTVFRNGRNMLPRPRLLMKSLRGLDQFFAEDIEQITGRISDREEVALHQSAHCYVQPSRGEGFGLVPLQAMALGRPTILTNAHGHASYAHLGIPISWSYKKADYFIFGDARDWWEPDFEELCEAMWDVYNNYDAHAARAHENARIVTRDWTWSNTTDAVLDAVGEHMRVPYSGTGRWLPAEKMMYRLTVNRPYYTEIAGRSLRFEVGYDYWESADVKRILFDAGVLSNDCLEGDDLGLAPIQVEQLGKYRAEHGFCPTCNQQLNSGIQKRDVEWQKLVDERQVGAVRADASA